MNRPSLACLVLVLSASTGGIQAQSSAGAPGPQIEHEIEHTAGRWNVRLAATHLDPVRRDVALELADWGEWTALDSAYLQPIRFAPELESASSTAGSTGDGARRWSLRLPEDWNGELEAEYSLTHLKAESATHDEHPLLPFATPAYTQAFLINTLMRVLVDGEPLEARQVVHIRAGEGETIATGWAGVSTGSQSSELPAGIDNAVIVIGELVGHRTALDGDAPCEVIQFARGPDVSGEALALVQALLSAYTRNTSRGLGFPVRVFLDDRCGGNIGGTRTDRGFVVQFDAREIGGEEEPEFRRLVAHELFHNWLGGLIRAEDESTVWFSEGFTEYLALWHLAAEGFASPEWFAAQLAGKDASIREEEAYGQVAFGDPDVDWRDGGPRERLVYRGGCVLAFHADVALRRAGRPGLIGLITDLQDRDGGRLTQESVRESFLALGLADFYRLYVAGRELPPLSEALVSIGFEPHRRDVNLAYLGIESSGDLGLGRVLSIDPEGPTAGKDLQIGDVLRGYYPRRSPPPPEIDGTVDTKYRFGLNRIALGIEGTYIDVVRSGSELQVPVTPQALPGGFRTEYEAAAEGVVGFFTYTGGR